jgi:hypothetical protein
MRLKFILLDGAHTEDRLAKIENGAENTQVSKIYPTDFIKVLKAKEISTARFAE